MGVPSAGAKDLIIAASVGSANPTDDWGVHLAQLPPEPMRAIAVCDTGGTSEGPNPAWLVDYRTIQAMVRAGPNEYVAGYQKTSDIKDALLGMGAQVVGGDRWDGVTGIGDVTYLGVDDNKCHRFVMNFRIIIEPAANAITNREPL